MNQTISSVILLTYEEIFTISFINKIQKNNDKPKNICDTRKTNITKMRSI